MKTAHWRSKWSCSIWQERGGPATPAPSCYAWAFWAIKISSHWSDDLDITWNVDLFLWPWPATISARGLHIRRFQFLHLQKWLWEIHSNAMVLSSAPSDKFAINVKMKAQSSQFGLQWLSTFATTWRMLRTRCPSMRECLHRGCVPILHECIPWPHRADVPPKLFLWIWLCSPRLQRKKLGEFSILSCPDFQAPRIGGKLQVESSCLSASKLAFWVLGRDSVWKLLLLRTYAKQRQEIPKYRCGLDQIVAAVHIQKSNKDTKKQPSRAHPSMFYNVSKGCGKALPVKAFVQFLARASRIQNSWLDFLGVAFHGLKQKQAWGFNGVDKGFEHVARRCWRSRAAPIPSKCSMACFSRHPLVGPSSAQKPYHNFSSLQFGPPTSSTRVAA